MQMQQDKLRELARDRANLVYEYTHDSPERVLDAGTQARLLREIVFEFDATCRANRTWEDEHIREHIMKANSEFRTFQALYPLVFASVTYRAKNAEAVARLDKTRKLSMLFIMERWKGEGDEGERHARAMHTAMRVAMRERTAADEGTEVTPPTDVPMTPIDASEMGECTVNQA